MKQLSMIIHPCNFNIKKPLATLLITLIFFTNTAWGNDYQKGLDAFKKQDYTMAIKEWLPLAEDGNSDAQFSLGLLYESGQGVLQNDETAAKWYTRAAEQGHALAQFALGGLYASGQGVLQNYKTAAKWYTRAAEQGNFNAQFNLGLLYESGQSVLQNYIYSHMWLNIAASNGDNDALKTRNKIAKKMTPSQIEEAQKRAAECVRKKYKGC